MRYALALLALLLTADASAAQDGTIHDTELAWRTYSAERSARVRVFHSEDDRRPHTVVVDDRAGNGAPITDEAGFVAELAGRELGVDPTAAAFVFRYTPAAFDADGAERGKTLYLKATFRRLATGGLASPSWRVISADAMDRLTDRAFR